MSPSTFRRVGGTLLLTIFTSACLDSPTAPPASDGGGEQIGHSGLDVAYRDQMDLLAEALAVGRTAALKANAQGLSREEVRAAASAASDAFLERHGIRGGVQEFRAPEADLAALLTARQLRLLEDLKLAVRDLGPSVTVAELEGRLARIERRAVIELSDAEREPILLAIAGVAEFWRANAESARFTSMSFPDDGSPSPLFAKKKAKDRAKATFTWGGLAGAVAEGIFIGVVSGAVGGAVWSGGSGAVPGAIAGGLGGGVAYGMDYLLKNLI